MCEHVFHACSHSQSMEAVRLSSNRLAHTALPFLRRKVAGTLENKMGGDEARKLSRGEEALEARRLKQDASEPARSKCNYHWRN